MHGSLDMDPKRRLNTGMGLNDFGAVVLLTRSLPKDLQIFVQKSFLPVIEIFARLVDVSLGRHQLLRHNVSLGYLLKMLLLQLAVGRGRQPWSRVL